MCSKIAIFSSSCPTLPTKPQREMAQWPLAVSGLRLAK